MKPSWPAPMQFFTQWLANPGTDTLHSTAPHRTAMRTIVKVYIAGVGLTTILLLGHDLSVLSLWPHPWSLGVTLALIGLTAIGEQLQFELRRGWYTNASAVAHVASAFLLPPGLAIAIAGLGAIVRALRYPLPLAKAGFNLA